VSTNEIAQKASILVDGDKLEAAGKESAEASPSSSKNETMMMMVMQAGRRVIGVGDYAFDDVRSYALHVLLFLTIFFGVFDAYLNLSAADIPKAALLFIYQRLSLQ